jgi:hypothetical protein
VAARRRISSQRDSLGCACGRLAGWMPAGWRTKRCCLLFSGLVERCALILKLNSHRANRANNAFEFVRIKLAAESVQNLTSVIVIIQTGELGEYLA